MLGQPISMLLPQVIGFKLGGELPRGRDRHRPRPHGDRDAAREGRGRQVRRVLRPRACRTSASPTGRRSATCRRSSARPARSSRSTPRRSATSSSPAGRPSRSSWSTPTRASRACSTSPTTRTRPTPTRSSSTSATSCRASPGPKRPQDRIALSDAKPAFLEAMEEWDPEAGEAARQPARRGDRRSPSRPRIRRPRTTTARRGKPRRAGLTATAADAPPHQRRGRPSQLEDGETVELDHGHVVIAAITSCTNTSNPSVMLGAGLVAKKAVERGLRPQALGQDLARAGLDGGHRVPGEVRARQVPRQAPVQPRRLRLHHLHRELRPAAGGDLEGGQREGPRRLLGALGQPQLRGPDQPRHPRQLPCLAAAGGRLRAGRADGRRPHHRADRPRLRRRARLPAATSGRPTTEIADAIEQAVRADMFTKSYSDVFTGDKRWKRDRGPRGRPLHLARLDLRPQALLLRGDGGRAASRSSRSRAPGSWPLLGDSVTTDHISPAGAIKKDSPAGQWLIENGVEVRDFNSYGARRGNHEVMIRGTFANVRLRNRLVEKEGGFTRHFPDGDERTQDDLRGGDEVRRGGRPPGGARRQGVRLGLLPRLGGQGHRSCSASAR